MAKYKRNPLPVDEDAIERMERDNEIFSPEETELRHPHEIMTPVGEDERDYMKEELTEQGYTEEGKGTRGKTEDDPNPNINLSRKVA